MKIVFNDSFATDPNLFTPRTDERSVYVSGNLILEKKIVTAEIPLAQIKLKVQEYKKSSEEKKKKMREEISGRKGDFSLWEEKDEQSFFNLLSGSASEEDRSEKPALKSKFERFIDTAVDDAEKITEPFEQNALKLEDRSVIIDRLKGFGVSDENIGQIFNLAFVDNPIPESEIISFLELIFDFAIEAGTNIEDIIFYALEHYSERRSKGVTYDVIKAASALQNKYPELNFFSMLRQSNKGQNFGFGKLAIIDDPKDMELVKLMFSLSQLKNLEQNDAVRRERQIIRDKVQAFQERINLQSALVSALDANEVERGLIKEIQKFGEEYKKLITNPIFRSLKKTQYIINAGRKLLDTWMTLYLDTQPITPRLSPEEARAHQQSISNTTGQGQSQNKDQFPSRRPSFFTTSNNNNNFYKLAQQSNQEDLTSYVKFFLKNFESQEEEFLNKIPANLAGSDLFLQTYNFYKNSYKQELNNQLLVPSKISFLQAHNKAQNATNQFLQTKTAEFSNNRFILAQSNPQKQNTQVKDTTTNIVQNVLKFGSVAAAAIMGLDAALELRKGKIGVLKLIGLIFVALQSYNAQIDLDRDKAGRMLSSSNVLFDANGNLTRQGADILANRAELDAIFAVIGPAAQAIAKQKNIVDRNKIAIDNFEKILNNQIFQSVDFGLGQTSSTRYPFLLPDEVKKRYEQFVVKLEDHLKLLRILKALYDKLKTTAQFDDLDSNQKRTLENAQLAVQVEIKDTLAKINDYKTTNIIRELIEEQKIAKNLLGQFVEQYEPFVDAGINISSIINQPDGFAQVYQFARENLSKQIDKLVERYEQLSEMIEPYDLGIQNVNIPQSSKAGTVQLGKPGEVTKDMVQ